MDKNVILVAILTLVIISTPYTIITICLDMQKEKEIWLRGHHILGKIESIHYTLINISFRLHHNCMPKVSFVWDGKSYRLRSLTTFPYRKYKKGSEIELLFLPEYPKKVVLKNEQPTTASGLVVDIVIILFCMAASIYVLIQLLK